MKIARLSFFAISTLCCSCVLFSHFQPDRPGEREFNKIREAKNPAEAREQFNSYSVDKQIDVYLFGLKYIEPDDNSVRKFLVSDGEKKLPNIIQRIQSSNEEFDKGYLMEVISLINKDCSCVTEEQKKTLFEIGSTLKDRYHRHRFQQALEDLEKGSTP